MKKLLPLFLVAIVFLIIVLLLRNGKTDTLQPTNMHDLSTEIKISAAELAAAFERDEVGANETYLNKIVAVTGKIEQITESGGNRQVILATRAGLPFIRCRMDRGPGQEDESYQVGESVKLKCVCSGLVNEVEMVQCIVQ